MNYRFATEDKNYEDYSSGRVLYNQQGATSFPVRLTSEVFQCCKNILEKQGSEGPLNIYDPCCGGAYLLTTLGYLHGEEISKIYASDFDSNIIPLAKKNLSLLGLEGLNERISEINKMINDFKKESHVDALNSALRLKNLIEKRTNDIDIECFTADITKDDIKKRVSKINIIITDLPYGDIVEWSGGQNENDAVSKFLENVSHILAETSIVAVVSQKKTAVKHDKFKRGEQFTIGKRKITLLQPINI